MPLQQAPQKNLPDQNSSPIPLDCLRITDSKPIMQLMLSFLSLQLQGSFCDTVTSINIGRCRMKRGQNLTASKKKPGFNRQNL